MALLYSCVPEIVNLQSYHRMNSCRRWNHQTEANLFKTPKINPSTPQPECWFLPSA